MKPRPKTPVIFLVTHSDLLRDDVLMQCRARQIPVDSSRSIEICTITTIIPDDHVDAIYSRITGMRNIYSIHALIAHSDLRKRGKPDPTLKELNNHMIDTVSYAHEICCLMKRLEKHANKSIIPFKRRYLDVELKIMSPFPHIQANTEAFLDYLIEEIMAQVDNLCCDFRWNINATQLKARDPTGLAFVNVFLLTDCFYAGLELRNFNSWNKHIPTEIHSYHVAQTIVKRTHLRYGSIVLDLQCGAGENLVQILQSMNCFCIGMTTDVDSAILAHKIHSNLRAVDRGTAQFMDIMVSEMNSSFFNYFAVDYIFARYNLPITRPREEVEKFYQTVFDIFLLCRPLVTVRLLMPNEVRHGRIFLQIQEKHKQSVMVKEKVCLTVPDGTFFIVTLAFADPDNEPVPEKIPEILLRETDEEYFAHAEPRMKMYDEQEVLKYGNAGEMCGVQSQLKNLDVPPGNSSVEESDSTIRAPVKSYMNEEEEERSLHEAQLALTETEKMTEMAELMQFINISMQSQGFGTGTHPASESGTVQEQRTGEKRDREEEGANDPKKKRLKAKKKRLEMIDRPPSPDNTYRRKIRSGRGLCYWSD